MQQSRLFKRLNVVSKTNMDRAVCAILYCAADNGNIAIVCLSRPLLFGSSN